jgi:hypothetical protein
VETTTLLPVKSRASSLKASRGKPHKTSTNIQKFLIKRKFGPRGDIAPDVRKLK